MEGLTRLTVFVSGTSEGEAEKAALQAAAASISEVLEQTRGVTIRVVAFPESIRPGVNTDPQSEINRQLTEIGYDIYVGILGSRFGTPTPRAGSGTEEEFHNALGAFKENTRGVRVLFYFKRSLIDPFTLDSEQLQRVKAFREGLGARGVLYRDFQNTAEFIEIIRSNLQKLILEEWEGEGWREISLATVHVDDSGSSPPAFGQDNDTPTVVELSDSVELSVADIDEPGLLDFAIEFQGAVVGLTAALKRISQVTVEIGRRFQLRTKETEAIEEERKQKEQVGDTRAIQEFLNKAKKIVGQAADDLDGYADSMAAEMSRFGSGNRALFASLRGLVDVERKEGTWKGPVGSAFDEIANLRQLLPQNIEHVTAFQAQVARMPPMTGRFKRARRRASTILGEFIVEIQYLIEESGKFLEEVGYKGREPSEPNSQSDEGKGTA